MTDKMKLMGSYTARGTTVEGTPTRIRVYQGTNKIAYRVIDFKIWSSDYDASSSPDVVGKLSKNGIGVTAAEDFMRADDDNQIAWAASAGSGDGGLGFGEGPVIDKENLVVDDLYVYGRSSNANALINYLVVMEKYNVDGWRGTLEMARDEFDGE